MQGNDAQAAPAILTERLAAIMGGMKDSPLAVHGARMAGVTPVGIVQHGT